MHALTARARAANGFIAPPLTAQKIGEGE